MPCIICSHETTFFLKKDGYSYNKCPSCGLLFVYPQPEAKHLTEEVYSEKAGYQKHRKHFAKKQTPHFKKILDYLEKNLPREVRTKSASVPRLLDVGCSNGDFLYFAKQRGFEPHGVEINELTAGVAESRGLNIKRGTLAEADYPNDFFDAVFLGDVIEHVQNPRELLLESHRVLKNGGTLIVSTPNLDSFWARATYALHKRFHIPWSVLTPPHHLFQFSDKNMKQFLTENGFKTTAVWFRGPPTLLYEFGSLHLFGKFKQKKTIKNFLYMIFAFTAYTMLYIFDILITPFKKKNFGLVVVSKKLNQ